MTVREMIKQLVMYPMDSQVLDTDGSPIMCMVFHNRETNDVRLEPKSQIDVDEWLDDFFRNAMECNQSDNDVAQELKDAGFTIDDLRNYKRDIYEWAMQTDVDW